MMPLTTPESSSNQKIKVTIGIPAYNESKRIDSLIRELIQQIDKSMVEIIINTSGSTDGTEKEVSRIIQKLKKSFTIKLIHEPTRLGKAAALDQILKKARGDILIFIDADTKLDKQCIKKILEPFSDKKVGVVSGNVASLNSKNGFFGFASHFQRELHNELCIDLNKKRLAPKVNGTFFAFRKEIINSIPYYVVSDDEYISKIAQCKGYRVVYAQDALVYTKDPTNFKDYLSKRKRIYEGHFLIKKQLNYTVPTTSLGFILPIFKNKISMNYHQITYMFLMISLEILARFFAIIDISQGKVPYRYRVESAKF